MTEARHAEIPLELSVELCPPLSALAEPAGESSARVRHAVQESVESITIRFGIPGSVSVALTAGGAGVDDGGKVVRVGIGGHTVRYPDDMLRQAWCYVTGEAPTPQITPLFVQEQLVERGDREQVVRFLSILCGKIVEREPASLLGPAQCRAYVSGLDTVTSHDPDWLLGVLRKVLEVGISIADGRRVAGVLEINGSDEVATVEGLISALRRNSIDILLDRPTLRELTMNWPTDDSAIIPFLRDGLFEELGLKFQRFQFVIDGDQGPGTFSFRINDFASIPALGLRPDQVMVNDTAERLGFMDFAGAAPIANPATGQPNGLIPASRNQEAQNIGLTTWTQSGHLVLSLAEFLRCWGWCTIHSGFVQRQLTELGSAFPALVHAATARRSDAEITATLRALCRDRVSIQNMPAVLESMLDFDLLSATNAGDESDPATALDDLAANVRIALGPAIAHRAARGTSTLVVYLVDPELDRILRDSMPRPDEERCDEILNAFRKEMAYLPPTAQVPSVLTSKDLRAVLQRLIAAEHPRIAVIADDELPPGLNVQPVARVLL